MESHRLASPLSLSLFYTDPPFSYFSHIANNYSGQHYPAIHRLFSLARSHSVKTLILENIPASGIIEDENDEVLSLYSDFNMGKLQRLSFWKEKLPSKKSIDKLRNKDCAGYAILKFDTIPSLDNFCKWHIFEAVFKKYDHRHNFIPNIQTYSFKVGDKNFQIQGVLYAQQSTLNKSCAHVAVRSLLSRYLPEKDISYRMLNDSASSIDPINFVPKNGLNVQQIKAILSKYKISFHDIDYTSGSEKEQEDLRKQLPYQKILYSGIESGYGGLLGFSLAGPGAAQDDGHMIPFFGHTFNKDTWVPDADIAYFKIGEKLAYISSENWTSSFLGHDDNFGPNFCVPRLYIQPNQVEYVVELLHPGVKFSGAEAEGLSLRFLYSILACVDSDSNYWLKQLALHSRAGFQKVVLRPITLDKKSYLDHLLNCSDWEGKKEAEGIITFLREALPEVLWVVEISLPQLFPANERKLGEIVLNATSGIDLTKSKGFDLFLFARIPTQYLFARSSSDSEPDFVKLKSNLLSHIPVLALPK